MIKFRLVSRSSRVIADAVRPPAGLADGGRAVARAFEVVARTGPMSRAELRTVLGVSVSTITLAVQELIERGYVAESGQRASTGGRPPMLLDASPKLGGVLAADIGGSNLRFAAADLRGTFIYRATVATENALASRSSLEDAVLAGLDAARAQLAGPARALAVSIAGIVDPATGSISRVDNIRGWQMGDDLARLRRLSNHVLIDNEANLGALGERRALGAAAPDDLLFVALGAGVGAGLILGGMLYRGATGAAGEVGLLRLGSQAALERVASASALTVDYTRRSGKRDVRPEDVVEMALGGDGDARASLDTVLHELADGIANTVIVLNPAMVVLGGGLAFALPKNRLLEPIQNRIAELVPAPPVLHVGRLGPEAALHGAVDWAADVAVAELTAGLLSPTVAHA